MRAGDKSETPNPRYTHLIGDREYRLYGCARRGCDKVVPDYWVFESRGSTYCLLHVPLLARLRVAWRERRK